MPSAPKPMRKRTPLERMTELTRRIVAVRKEEITAKPKPKKRRH